MNQEYFEEKNVMLNGKEVKIKFYTAESEERLSAFLIELSYFYGILKDKKETWQQFMHSLLIIKHFTDYDMGKKGPIDLIQEGKNMLDNKSFDVIVGEFDTESIYEINEHVALHMAVCFGKIPSYLAFVGENKETYVEKIMKDVEDIKDESKKFSEKKKEEKFPLEKIYITYELPKSPKKKKEEEKVEMTTDMLLDEYNDYVNLYEEFKDIYYFLRTQHILYVLNKEEEYIELK